MSAPRCFPGRILNHRYRLEEVIGKGGVATVWRGHDLRNDRPCALKILKPEAACDQQERRRLAREGSLGSRLCHPNLPLMYALDEDSDGTPFLIMELLVGRTLRALLNQRGRLTFGQASHVLQQIGRGVSCAHTMGVLHRDLKPQNIVLQATSQSPGSSFDVLQAVVKIVDFGLASERQTIASPSICAPLARDLEYRAPELLDAAGGADTRTDQWSIAVMAYELLTGVRPFADPDPVHLALQIREGKFTPLSLHRPDLPAYVGAAIERALSLQAHERFASVADFLRALHGDWPRMFRIATPVTLEHDMSSPADLFGAAVERRLPHRSHSPLRTAAFATLTLLAFVMPFSWVGGVTGRRTQPPHSNQLLAGSRAPAPKVSPKPTSTPAARKTLPPLRLADLDTAWRYPPLRLCDTPSFAADPAAAAPDWAANAAD